MSEDVVWGPNGLDRLHVPTGTLWRFGIDHRGAIERYQWALALSGSEWLVLERLKSGDWRVSYMESWSTTVGPTRRSEGEAIQAALDARDWAARRAKAERVR